MNVGLLVDASCDLPQSIYERYDIHLLPCSIVNKREVTANFRDMDQANLFYNETSEAKLTSYKPLPPSREDINKRLLDELIYKYDHLLVIAPHLKISESLSNIREELFDIQPQFEILRKQASVNRPFKIRVIESNSGYAGYGLVLYEALRLMHEKSRSVDQLKQPLDVFKHSVHTYVMPGNIKLAEPPFNLSWLQQQKNRLHKSTPLFRLTNSGLEVAQQLESHNLEGQFLTKMSETLAGLKLTNHLVNLSYAGKLARLRVTPQFQQLHAQVKAQGGKMVYSMMSLDSASQLGLGALTLAFATEG